MALLEKAPVIDSRNLRQKRETRARSAGRPAARGKTLFRIGTVTVNQSNFTPPEREHKSPERTLRSSTRAVLCSNNG